MGDSELGPRITSLCTSIISVVATLFIFYIFLRLSGGKKKIHFAWKFVVFLCFSDFLWGFLHIGSFLVHEIDDEPKSNETICMIESITTTFSRLAIIFWTTGIALANYLITIKDFKQHAIANKEWVFTLLCYGLPALISIT